MPQFDVFRNPRGGRFPLLVDVQSHAVSQLDSRVVVPLVPRKKFGKPISRLQPIVTIGGTEYVVLLHQIAAMPLAALGPAVDSLASRRDDMVSAIDMLLTGI